ncbi:MAG: lysylphosphatidylglycerol synthase domain-containing protein [Ignavibacteriaceae bacterium]|nr:lysylphosphatidylglycerol synthase domain-containing protein [Ignavibacteriaceae bacterium]
MTDKNSSSGSLIFRFLSKNTIIIAAKILISAGLLYYLISSVEYNQIILALNEANIAIIGVVILLGVVNIFLQYSKWRLTCAEVLEVNDKFKIFRSLFYGFSAGIITPLRIGEYFGRGIEFRDKSLVQVTVATLVDKFFPLMMVASFGSVSSLLFIYVNYDVSIYIVLSLFIIIFTFFYLLIVLLLSNRFWNSILFSKLNSSVKLKPFLEKLRIFESLDRNYFFKMLVISFLFYSCFLIQYALLVSAFSNHFDFGNYLWAANLIMFAKTIIPPISFGELGIREGASVYFLTQMGETASVGFNSSILLFIINLLIPALIGVGMFLRKNDN